VTGSCEPLAYFHPFIYEELLENIHCFVDDLYAAKLCLDLTVEYWLVQTHKADEDLRAIGIDWYGERENGKQCSEDSSQDRLHS
jgi:hypothetical protein